MQIPYSELFQVMDNQIIQRVNNNYSVEHLNESFFENCSIEKKYPGGKSANITHMASIPNNFVNGINILTKPNEGCFVLSFLLNEKKPYIKGFNANIPIELSRFLNQDLNNESVSDIIHNTLGDVTLEQVILLDYYGLMIASSGGKLITTHGQTITNMIYAYSSLTNRPRAILNGEVIVPNLLETIRDMKTSYGNFRHNNTAQFQLGNSWPEVNNNLLMYKSLIGAIEHLNLFQRYSFNIGDLILILDQV